MIHQHIHTSQGESRISTTSQKITGKVKRIKGLQTLND